MEIIKTNAQFIPIVCVVWSKLIICVEIAALVYFVRFLCGRHLLKVCVPYCSFEHEKVSRITNGALLSPTPTWHNQRNNLLHRWSSKGKNIGLNIEDNARRTVFKLSLMISSNLNTLPRLFTQSRKFHVWFSLRITLLEKQESCTVVPRLAYQSLGESFNII